MNDDQRLMRAAIALAEQCRPIADRVPKVGAVIAVNGVIIGQAHRGTGALGDDDHAEKTALEGVADRKQLPKATVYTTLEPCTPEVRSDPLNCCTELIRKAEVKRVFIGILDPNQGVRGKGLWELQNRGIEVELFPPKLATRIRVLNDKFIKEQQTLGIRISNLTAGQTIRTYDNGGVYELQGTFLNPPGEDVFVLTSIGTKWWPQPYSLQVTGDKTWSVRVHFGSNGPHTLAIVRANELGIGLIGYYRKVVRQNLERSQLIDTLIRGFSLQDVGKFMKALGGNYPAIEMAKLPKGIELQAQVEVVVENPPNPPE